MAMSNDTPFESVDDEPPYPVSSELYAIARRHSKWSQAAQVELDAFMSTVDVISVQAASLPGPALKDPRMLDAFIRAGVPLERVYWPALPEGTDVRRWALHVNAPPSIHRLLDASGVSAMPSDVESVASRVFEAIRNQAANSLSHLVAHSSAAVECLVSAPALDAIAGSWMENVEAKKSTRALVPLVHLASRAGANWSHIAPFYRAHSGFESLMIHMLEDALPRSGVVRAPRPRL